MGSEMSLREMCNVGALFLTDGYRTRRDQLASDGAPILRVAHVREGFIEVDKTDRISYDFAPRFAQKTCQVDDVVITTKGTVGRIARVPKRFAGYVYSPQVCVLRVVDPEALDPAWLYCWARSPEFQDQLALYSGQTDMAPYVKLKDLLEFGMTVPPIEDQRAIAEVLGALDDRIEWCRRTEATCIALLTTRFSQAATTEVSVGDVATVVAGQSPPGSTYNTEGLGLPLYQGSAQFGSLVPVADRWCSAPSRTAIPGDILFSVRAPVGDVNVATEDVCIGRGLAAIRSDFRAAIYAALRLASSVWSIHDGSGTVFGSINGRDLRAAQIPWPSTVEGLAPTLEAFMDRALATDAERRSIMNMRDALLLPLLSGELRIDNPERLLEGVA